MPRLEVNIDHVATLRQARLTNEPDPVTAAALAELAGADGIIVHLREDRRHIQDRDLELLRQTVKTRLNLEMAATPEMLTIAREVKPDLVTLVPEKRQELTTEGGLEVVKNLAFLKNFVQDLKEVGLRVSLFVDPETAQIDAAKDVPGAFLASGCGTDHLAVEDAKSLKAGGASLAGVSAPAKGMTLLNYCRIGPELLDFITEKSRLKIGRYTPGMHIPIVPDSALVERGPDYALLLAWNFADEIIENLGEYRDKGGKFIIPIPKVSVI